MSKTLCIDCRKEVPDGTVCSCQKIIKIQSDHFKTLWLGIKIGMILGTKLTISIGNDCNDKECPLFVSGGVHQKGSTLCKYAKSMAKRGKPNTLSEQNECKCHCHCNYINAAHTSNYHSNDIFTCPHCSPQPLQEVGEMEKCDKCSKYYSISFEECPNCEQVKEGDWEEEFQSKFYKFDETAKDDMGEKYTINEFQVYELTEWVSKQIQLAVLEERQKRIEELKKIEATGKCLDIPKYIEYLTKEIK